MASLSFEVAGIAKKPFVMSFRHGQMSNNVLRIYVLAPKSAKRRVFRGVADTIPACGVHPYWLNELLFDVRQDLIAGLKCRRRPCTPD